MKLTALLFFSLLLTACGGSSSGDSKSDNNDPGGPVIDNEQATDCTSSSSYQEFSCVNIEDFIAANGIATNQSKQIANCTILDANDQACKLSTLDFIANTSTTPTKQQILDKLIVSHQWMADNFSQFLDSMPDDMYNLFGSVTSIVIHSDIRPAFFWGETGAIYLDPEYLWITQEELDTISKEEDYRSSFDDDLSFFNFWRYTKNGSYAFSSNGQRSQTQAVYALSALLFHELAHARDFFPTDQIASATSNNTPAEIITLDGSSTTLSFVYPLTSDTMFDLAKVQYHGETATNNLIALSASEVGSIFEADGASANYSYSSHYEDTASIFEETMMKIHYDIDRETAFITELNNTPESCDDYAIGWSDVNRFMNNNVAHRAKLAIDALLPAHSHDSFFANLVSDGSFTWCAEISPEKTARGIGSRSDKLTIDFWH